MMDKEIIWIRIRLFFVMAVTLLLLGGYSGWRLVDLEKRGYVGLVLYPADPDSTSTSIFLHAGDNPARHAGLQSVDEVLRVNGVPVSNHEELKKQKAATGVGDTLTYTLLRGGEELDISVQVGPSNERTQVLRTLVKMGPVALIYLLLGMLLIWKKPADRRVRVIFWVLLAASVVFLLPNASHADSDNPFGLNNFDAATKAYVFAVFISILCTFLLHLALIFPKDRPVVAKRPYFVRVLYFPVTVAVLGLITLLITFRYELPKFLLATIIPASFICFAITFFYVFPIALTIRKTYQESTGEERSQLRWPFWGTMVSLLSYFLLTVVSVSFQFTIGISPAFITVIELLFYLVFLLVPLSFVIAIFKYRLMDIELIIKRTLVYSILTGLILAFYVIVVAGMGRVLVNFIRLDSQWLTIGATLAVAALFVPVRSRIQQLVHRRFFRRDYDYPQVLSALSNALRDLPDRDALLRTVAERLQQSLGCRSVVLFLREQPSRPLRAVATIGLPDQIRERLILKDETVVQAALAEGLNPSLEHLNRNEQQVLKMARTDALIPVSVGPQVMALISLGSKLDAEPYDEQDRTFVVRVAEQLGAGLAESYSREQVADAVSARKIQEGLLPARLPQLPGLELAGLWQPARAVGGDYYDALQLGDRVVGMCIADVAGKGIPAALLMSNLQASFRALASPELAPEAVCGRLNRILFQQSSRDKFITFFYAIIDLGTGRLAYANAGHNRPIIVKADGSTAELKEAGPALGLVEDFDYTAGEAVIEAGDRCVLYTDGVTETWNQSDEEYGESRLIELIREHRELNAEGLVQRILAAVTEFSHGEAQDDISLLVAGKIGNFHS